MQPSACVFEGFQGIYVAEKQNVARNLISPDLTAYLILSIDLLFVL